MIATTLFSGIGAPETAMPSWRWPWSAEIEKFPAAVLRTRHADSENLGDVTADDFTERAAEIARPDVLIFGSPCQSYSVAGKRLGLDDPRGNLALVALGIIDRLKPGWFVFENVPGLLSSSEGRDFGLFLRAVDELGYFGAWAGLDAQWFGVAQRRERLFFVGNSRDWRGSAAVLFEPESLCGHSPPRREAGQRPAPTIASRPTGGGGLGTDFDCDGGLIAGTLGTRSAAHPSGTKAEADFMIAQPLLAKSNSSHDDSKETYVPVTSHCLNGGGMGRQDYETETVIAHALRADGFDASEDGTGRGTPLIADTVRSHPRPGSNSVGLLAFSCKDHGADASTLAPTLRAMGHDGSHANAGGQVAIAFQSKASASNSMNPDVIAPTLNVGKSDGIALYDDPRRFDARGVHGGFEHGDLHPPLNTVNSQQILREQSAVRRLTPRECERLQGFPDDYTLIEYRGKPAADGPRYKALGNSMAVPVMRWILGRIETANKQALTSAHCEIV